MKQRFPELNTKYLLLREIRKQIRHKCDKNMFTLCCLHYVCHIFTKKFITWFCLIRSLNTVEVKLNILHEVQMNLQFLLEKL